MKPENPPSASCPLPVSSHQNIQLAHGGGGKLMHQLIENEFLQAFQNPLLNNRHDGAVFNLGKSKLAFTTDSYVIRPLFFPGGDIGALAVNGTVNDLAMCGARPLYLSAGFILEEGLPVETLRAIIKSMRQSADSAGVQIVTGDTKVVDKGKGDGIFINTAGIGIVEHDLPIGPASIQTGDAILLSGDIGRHGMAIMAVREGLAFESVIESDCAPLADLVLSLIGAGVKIHCLRDLTRGGLASALVELAEASQTSIEIDENKIPVREDVQGACEILGFDPLYVANEGRFIAFVPPADVELALNLMHKHPLGIGASLIGAVNSKAGIGCKVALKTKIGATRLVDMISGEQLPRIC
jgi:hydrogenase expression/formation protein HypE